MNNFPYTLNAKALARLLSLITYKTEKTILRDISRKPQSLPPHEICGGKKIWCTEVVLDWLPSTLRAFARHSLSEEYKETKQVRYPPPIPLLADMLLAGSPSAKSVRVVGGES
ncbi:MAG: hypothetical protein PHI29_03525 [Gallionella sp.]|nr:hypothetical protein [Gallionella sp.]